MEQPGTGTFAELGSEFADYLPTLAAGLIVLAIGVVLGWLARRSVIAFLKWIRLDRLGGRESWRSALTKADVREALYSAVGAVIMALIGLVFLENALQIWGLSVLAGVVERFLRYLPHVGLATVIVVIGLVLANIVADRVEGTFEEAGLPNQRLAARMCKAALLAVVGALALWELDFAREIVLAAFLIGFGAIGVAFALAVGIGTAQAIRHGWEQLVRARRDQKQDSPEPKP